MNMILRYPTEADEQAVRAIHARLVEEDNFEFLQWDAPWGEILERIRKDAAGEDLPESWVPADFLLAEVDGEIVGRASIRHRVDTEYLLNANGHVGYGVAPEHRRRGYAQAILHAALARCRDLGITQVLVTCDDTNVGSARVIESCGGVLEDIRTFAGGPPKRRYWIDAEGAGRVMLRSARAGDASDMCTVQNRIFEAGLRRHPATEDGIRDNYLSHEHTVSLTVAEKDGEVVGFQSLKKAWPGNPYGVEPGWGIIGTHIRPDAGRAGLGRRLWARSLRAAQEAGLEHIDAHIGATSEGALAYYQAMGFVPFENLGDAIRHRFDVPRA